jgi:hypothetical protein
MTNPFVPPWLTAALLTAWCQQPMAADAVVIGIDGQSVFERSGQGFASRKRVKSRI